jgi:hypothetical protein
MCLRLKNYTPRSPNMRLSGRAVNKVPVLPPCSAIAMMRRRARNVSMTLEHLVS